MPSRIATADKRGRGALTATLVCAVLVVMVLLAAIVSSRRSSGQTFDRMQRFANLVLMTDALMQGVTDAETGQRGYAITGRTIYLGPYERGLAVAQKAELDMRASIEAAQRANLRNPAVDAAVERVVRTKAAALDTIRQNVELVRTGNSRRALAAILTDEGKDRMDELRAAVADLRGRATTAVSTLNNNVVIGRAGIDRLIAALISVLLISGLLGGWILVREAAVIRLVGEELSKATQDALSAKVRAEDADAAKTRFLAMASHDMRQPLHALTLYLSSLKRRAETPKTKEIVLNMEKAAESLTRMFSGLLDLARIEAGVLKPQKTEVALAEIFDSLSSELSNDAERERVRLIIVPTSLHIVTDPELMQSVLRNLLTNAIKYAPNGRVLLGARRRGARVFIEVHDEGPGIPEEKLVIMFGEFVRLERSNAALKEGLGLGLSIASRVASMLGAELQVFSQMGKGTCFWITADIAATPAITRRPAPAGHRDLTGVRIAVLDDEPDSLGAMLRVIDDAGGAATGFGFAERYIEAVRGGARFDLLIADPLLHTHVRTALEGADKTPAIIVTGATDVGTLARLERRGVPWLVKPIPEDQLIAQAALHATRAPQAAR